MNVNRITMAGNLVKDPDFKQTPKGTAVCSFTVALNRRYKSKDGESKEEVSFIGCVAYGSTADFIAKNTKKGGRIIIEGRLKQDRWDDKETGKKESRTKVLVENAQIIDWKNPKPDEKQPEGIDADFPEDQTAF